MIDRYIPGKNSKSNNKLDLVNTLFGVTYKSFYFGVTYKSFYGAQ